MGTELLRTPPATEPALQVYLLGQVEFEAALALQHRLAYEVAGARDSAVALLCEHHPLITVGRQGSRRHILCEPEELRARRWPVRWVNRGGGCLLHLPGQLALYPIFPLDRLGLGLQAYLDRLQQVVLDLLGDFDIRGQVRPGHAGVWVGPREIAAVGVAVRDWVSYYGLYVNVSPSLDLFRLVRRGPLELPMTSLERERHNRVRPAFVRERLVEHLAARFGFARTSVFFEHAALRQRASFDAVAASY